MIEHRAYSVLNVKGMQQKPDGLTISGIASTPVTDRQGDIVEPLGAKFKTPMPLLWQHKADMPVGHVTFARPTKDGIPFEAFLPNVKEPGRLKDRVDEAIHSLQYKLVGAVSIGFKAIKGAVESIKGGSHFKEWEWLELSLVTIPANQEATIHTIKSLDQQQRAASGAEIPAYGSNRITIDLPALREKPSTFSHKGTGMNTSIAEQISLYEGERTNKVGQMSALMDTAAQEGRTLNEDESKSYEDLAGGVEGINKHVDNLRRHEKLLLTATPVTPQNAGDPDAASANRQNAGRPQSAIFTKSNLPAGTGFTRLCMAMMAGKGSESDTERYIARHFRDTPQVGMAYKAAVAAGTTTDANWAAPLVNYTDLASEFVELLRPKTIIGRLTQLRRVPFNVRFAKLAAGATAGWVGQGLAKPVSALDFDTITFPFYKLATIVVLTEELVRFSSPSAEAACRQEIVSAVAQKMDTSFIDPSVAAVANVSPASITNGITPVANPGTSVTTITAALTSVLSTVATNNVDLSTGTWIMRPQTAVYLSTLRTTQDVLAFPGMALTGGNLLGFPVVVSGNMSSDTGSSSFIVFVVQDEIFIADDGATRVDASREASLQMDSAPSAGAQSLVSLWQNNLVGLRAERFANWARRRDTAVGVIEDVSF